MSQVNRGESLITFVCRRPPSFAQMESPVSTPAPPPLHLLASVGSNDIASPCEQLMVRTRSVAVNTSDVALSTEPECLGPCEPGTSVNLEGIVWQETEDGKGAECFLFWVGSTDASKQEGLGFDC